MQLCGPRFLCVFLYPLISIRNVACQCSAGTTTVDAAGASSLAAACSTFTGSIALATGISENVTMDGILEITEDLIMYDVTNLLAVSFNSLATIGGSLTLSRLTILEEFDSPQLTSLGSLSLAFMPSQQSLSFFQTLQQCNSININNTLLEELQGFNLQTIATVLINDNPYMESINLQINNITNSLIVEANGRDLDLSMPNLESIFDMTVNNASRLSTPTLAYVNGSLSLGSNNIALFQSPLLQSIGGTLNVTENSYLQNLTLPSLRSIGGDLNLSNNTNLTTINQMDALSVVGGAIVITGPVELLDLPNLEVVRGAFNLSSSETVNCSQFASLAGTSNIIRGTFSCTSDGVLYNGVLGASNTTSTANGTSTTSGSDNLTSSPALDSTGLSTGAKAGIGIGVTAGVLAILGGVVWLYFRRRRSTKHANEPADHPVEKDGAEIDIAAMLSTDGQQHELEQPLTEMPLGNEAHELPAKHGITELGRSLSSKMPDGIEARHEMAANEEVEGTTEVPRRESDGKV